MRNIVIAAVIVFFAVGVGVGGVKIVSTIRGIRNNNPLNIEKGQDWQGEGDAAGDSRFEVFTDAVYGIRAAARILNTYAKRGANTLEKIITTWAPPVENDTEAYIKFVMKQTGFKRDQVMNKSAGDYVPLLAAMIKMENGVNPYSTETIEKGVSLA